LTVLIVQLTLY